MSHFRTLWCGMLTKDSKDSGTDSSIVLTINQNGVDTLNHDFKDTSQADQERGQANLYGFYVEDNLIHREELGDSSIRIGIRGEDAWRPQHFFIWGQDVEDNIIYPLIAEIDMNVTLSTNQNEGVLSVPMRRVAIGSDFMEISRLAIFVKTHDIKNAGTDSTINLQMSSGGSLVFDYDFPDTTQKDLERGQANLYLAPIGTPFSKRDLDDQSILLSIKGTDLWRPDQMMIFGLNQTSGRPTAMITLVSRNWTAYTGKMSTDSSEGDASVVLPLAPSPLQARLRRFERGLHVLG